MADWEDFLNAFDKGQDDVKVTWGPAPKVQRNSKADAMKQRRANMAKFVGGGITARPTAVKPLSPKDQDRIRKLEAMLNDRGTTDGEKAAAKAAIERIKSK